MPNAAGKTVRFSQIVERSGRPRAHTLWMSPEKDPEFKRALDSNRVMTIEPASRGNTDVGKVGFTPAATKRGQFLIFPKSLQRFKEARVVGIKFDLVEQPKLMSVSNDWSVSRTKARAKKPKPFPALKIVDPAAADSEGEANSKIETLDPKLGPTPIREAQVRTQSTRRPPGRSQEQRSEPKRVAPSAPSGRSTRPPRPERFSGAENRLHTTAAAEPRSSESALVREVRTAMKDLERGKSVAAYQRLERALKNR